MLRLGKVEITGGFLLLMAWLNYTDTQGLLLLGVCAAAAHEVGHWLAVVMVGGKLGGLRLSAVGAQMRLVGTMSYGRELICVLAGPAVNLAIGYLAARQGWFVFAGMNAALGAFNLLPAGTLDGGRAVQCLLSLLYDPDSAIKVRRGVDIGIAVILVALGLVVASRGGSVTLVIVGGWLLLSSGTN